MNDKFQISTKAWIAFGLVVALYAFIAVSGGSPFSTLCYALVAISTAGVAAFDSTHIHLRRYKTWISYGPVGLFFVCALFWPLVIVLYFAVRVRIARGTMPLRDDCEIKRRAA